MNTPAIDIVALRSFCALMDERSVSRAASRLGIKQPMMSRMLGKLRSYFGDPLLLWAAGHMVPTPRALQLESDIRELLVMADRIASPPQVFDPRTSELTIRVVSTAYMENMLLAKVISALAAQAPGCRLEVRPPDRLRDTAALEKGQIDFLIGWNLQPAPILRSRVLLTDRLVCIVRVDHPDIGDSLPYDRYVEMEHVQFDIPDRTTTVQVLQERLARAGRQLNIRFRVQSFLTVAEVVANSNMAATLSERYVNLFLKQYPIKVLHLPIRLPPMQNRIFWHERIQTDPASRWFRSLVADTAKTM